MFTIAESNTFIKVKKKLDPKLYNKIKNIVYPQLKENPFFGSNIKKLKGDLDGYYRFRLGNYRLFYLIDNDKVMVVVIDLKSRQRAYAKK